MLIYGPFLTNEVAYQLKKEAKLSLAKKWIPRGLD